MPHEPIPDCPDAIKLQSGGTGMIRHIVRNLMSVGLFSALLLVGGVMIALAWAAGLNVQATPPDPAVAEVIASR